MAIDDRLGEQSATVPAEARSLGRVLGDGDAGGERLGERRHRRADLSRGDGTGACQRGRGGVEVVAAEVEHGRVATGETIRVGDHLEAKGEAASVQFGLELGYSGFKCTPLDRDAKLAFLRSLDLLSVPATYDEPKGVFLLEAMASGVPVVQPRRGAFTEIVARTGGGLLVAPDDPAALADAFYRLWQDRELAATLGARGAAGVAAHYSVARSTDRLLEMYRSMLPAADRSVPVHESIAR